MGRGEVRQVDTVVVHFIHVGGQNMSDTRMAGMRALSDKGSLLEAIRNYDAWFLEERLRHDALIADSEICTAIDRFKNFMFLNAIGYSRLNVPIMEIDIVWHTFLLFTAEYADFCDRYIGRFVHHVPVTSRSSGYSMDKQDLIEIYEKIFGENLATNDTADCESCRAQIGDVAGISRAVC
jgi:hypothetical protein